MSAPGNKRSVASPNTSWETPWPLFNLLDKEFHFTLDAAASDANHKCERYLTEAENALKATIAEEVVFCNPPYGRGISDWVRAFQRWDVAGSTVVALLPANTDTYWFGMVARDAVEIRLLQGRVQFVGAGNKNTGGSMVAVYRPLHTGPTSIWSWDWRWYLP